MKTIKVTLSSGSYNIYVGKGILKRLGCLVKAAGLPGRGVIISTPPILKLFENKVKKAAQSLLTRFLAIPDTEKSKNANLALKIIEKVMPFDKSRGVFLAALGGGVAGDLTGFVAAIYKRGIPYIQIPTSLLAQIDSSIGGKTAVDTRFGKNLIGAFYQPRFVLADTDLLATLPKKELMAGLSEAVKYGLIKDPGLYRWIARNAHKLLQRQPRCLEHLVCRCADIKARVVSRDERDTKDIRIVLNFGHTIGHAVEAASDFTLSHGESVAIGMACACDMSAALGLLDKDVGDGVIALLETIGLPTRIQKKILGKALRALAHDKKFKAGKNRFVLLKRIGETRIVGNIPADVIREILTGRLS
ncbi:MAG: 3-dehydroquinate synthase [Candidatus Omnitrophica bacterium]|nr:3-dehydroquinate synthase [Candidatus Omnitrophota bacterium]MDD5138065.1 3-dehydroquinate synthase [Candidatus Omnitrophota bacterium]MDD5537751.1 3-dehydroquinate synthase [Candidatus Omnitrophota bacterium]